MPDYSGVYVITVCSLHRPWCTFSKCEREQYKQAGRRLVRSL